MTLSPKPFLPYVRHIVDWYRETIGDSDEHLSLLRWQIEQGHHLEQRETMPGHVTTSAFVLSHDYKSTLLIDHITIGRWLQPGGHYEGDGSLRSSAAREAVEETAVPGLTLHPWHANADIPFVIDSHDVPGKTSRNEPVHVHHDFQYLFLADPTLPLAAQKDEVHGAAWKPIEEMASFSKRVLPRLRRLGFIR